MTDPQQQLHDALDVLDVAFAPRAELPTSVGGCTYCYGAADLEALAGPVGRIPDELVRHVAHEGSDHWVDFPGLYRKLAPRIARLLAADQLINDMTASRFLAAGWRDWSGAERTALENVWHATPELLPWLLSLEDDRIGAAQLREVERIAYGY